MVASDAGGSGRVALARYKACVAAALGAARSEQQSAALLERLPTRPRSHRQPWGRLLRHAAAAAPTTIPTSTTHDHHPARQDEVTRAYLNNYITCFMVPEVHQAFAGIPQIMMW